MSAFKLEIVYKRCPCCGRTFTFAEWEALPGLKFWPAAMCEPGTKMEQRDCACGSSIIVTSAVDS